MTRAQFPEKLEFLFKPSRYKVCYGGRGGAKSWGFARALLIMAAQKKLCVLCARELQNSIADSVHKLLDEQIHDLGLSDFYEVQQTTIKGRNGSEFLFSGLKSNITKVKSKEGIDICWVEEAQTVSADSWATLIPTIRADGSEVWISFNPDLESDPTYQKFVVDPPPDCKVVEIGWQDNPWFPEVLAKEKDYLYRVDSDAANHVWGGQTRKNSVAAVLRGRYRVESFDINPLWNGPYFGADWGFGVDPTALVRCYVSDKRELFVDYEAYGVGVDIDDTPKLFDSVPQAKDRLVWADCSRPETISYMQRHGYGSVVACSKWPGSVEDGVEFLRSFESIVIHPRCKHTAEEARLWSYKVDRLTSEVLPVLADKHNHCWDAIRYALGEIIKAGRPQKAGEKKPEPARDYRGERKEKGSWKTS